MSKVIINGKEYICGSNNIMKGATASISGIHGLVPAPNKGDQDKFLKGDGTWDNPPSNISDSVKYNKDTDNLDVYSDGILAGSIPCGFVVTSKVINFSEYSWSKSVSSDTLTVSSSSVKISAYGSSPPAAMQHNFNLTIDFTGFTKAKLSFQVIDNSNRFSINDIYKPYINISGTSFLAAAGTYTNKEFDINEGNNMQIMFYTFSDSTSPTVVNITKLELVK